MAGPYYNNTKLDDINNIAAADLEAIETGFSEVDNDKANKNVPGTTGDLAALSASGDLSDSGKTPPSGEIVGTTDTQTLTDKTLTAPTINDGEADADFTLNGCQIAKGLQDTISTDSGTGAALTVQNGPTLDYTMTANATFTDSLSNGEGLMLILRGGDSYTFTPPAGSTWVNSDTPVLNADDMIVATKVAGQLILQYVGEVTA